MPVSPKSKDLYSVEISHAYLDQPFSSDQIQSVERFHDTSAGWNQPHDEIVLFDNYNVNELKTPHEEIFKELKAINAYPKYFAFEKDLIQYSHYLIENITVPKIKRQYEVYINKNDKYPCSLLTATWYLTRLGYVIDTKKVIKTFGSASTYKPATKLINFLPAHFSVVEEKSKKLIQATNFSEAVGRIENIFFDSDEIDSVVKRDLV